MRAHIAICSVHIPPSISEVFVLVFDAGVGDSGDAGIFLPVVTELPQPVEICVRRHLWRQRKRERERRDGEIHEGQKNKYSEIVLLFHSPTIVLGVVGLYSCAYKKCETIQTLTGKGKEGVKGQQNR